MANTPRPDEPFRDPADPGRQGMDRPSGERAADLPPGAGTKPRMGTPGASEQSRPYGDSGGGAMPGSAGRTRTTPARRSATGGDIERRRTGELTGDRDRGDDWGVARILTLLSGLAFLAIAIAGFVETGFDNFADHATGETVLGFEVNPLHNIVHLAFGVLALAMCTRRVDAARFGLIMAVGYGATFVYGLFAVDETWDFLSLNRADNWLHLGLAVLGLIILLVASAEDPTRRNPTSTRSGIR